MNYNIVILNSDEIKCPKVLLFVYKEMCEGFSRLGFNVRIEQNIENLRNNDIVFMGNDIQCENRCDLLTSIAQDAIYIAWYWPEYFIENNNITNFINTYENMKNIEYNKERYYYLNKLRESKYNTPLFLRANDSPDMIGKYKREIERDYCYMGWKYCYDYIPSDKYDGIYYGFTNHDDFLDYDQRKKIYLSSMFALGFQCGENIFSEHVSQRIFEGLAYGCIVLTNSLPACEQLDNIPVHITCKEDIEYQIDYFKNNPHILLEKQKQGYEYIKKYGTNTLSVQNYINYIQTDMNIIIEKE